MYSANWPLCRGLILDEGHQVEIALWRNFNFEKALVALHPVARPVPPGNPQHLVDDMIGKPVSHDLGGNAADNGKGRNVLGYDSTRSQDSAMTYGDVGQDRHIRADPDIVPDNNGSEVFVVRFKSQLPLKSNVDVGNIRGMIAGDDTQTLADGAMPANEGATTVLQMTVQVGPAAHEQLPTDHIVARVQVNVMFFPKRLVPHVRQRRVC